VINEAEAQKVNGVGAGRTKEVNNQSPLPV